MPIIYTSYSRCGKRNARSKSQAYCLERDATGNRPAGCQTCLLNEIDNRHPILYDQQVTWSSSCSMAYHARTLANRYQGLILGAPNFGGLGPWGPMQITEFRASGARMYGPMLHRILVLWDHVWYNFHWKSDYWVKYRTINCVRCQD